MMVGYEGTKEIASLGVYDIIIVCDLTKQDLDFSGGFDFVLCLEVGEHIPQKHEQTFINNIFRAVKKDLVLSWAPPGQYSASGHFNCREKEYIIAELYKRGLYFDRDLSEKLCRKVFKRRNI